MAGTIAVGLIAIAAYLAGVSVWVLLVAITVGTWVEYRWIHKRKEDKSDFQ
ncbi:hypothetical protein [Pseudohongiella spirulinae]|uniref:Uncharacterized protein n=1 Tax=Pseudohongiella spirulinae TaxID=1249552 RepID=A0A0S2KB31_9GAMM|nr:hypothetical protein [Pseudohongiella spirulinae]ALO45496.1 hypothetical protein PS2015_822 [Pseudohongiella spirulinae]